MRRKKSGVCSVLSGNRNFEGSIQSQVRANYLAVAATGRRVCARRRMTVDLTTEPIGKDSRWQDVYLREIWRPSTRFKPRCSARQSEMVPAPVRECLRRGRAVAVAAVPIGNLFAWDERSTYVRKPPFVEGISRDPAR